MGKRDPRVDAYIEKAADFAKPILMEIRERVHAACPEVEEAIDKRSGIARRRQKKLRGGLVLVGAAEDLDAGVGRQRIALDRTGQAIEEGASYNPPDLIPDGYGSRENH